MTNVYDKAIKLLFVAISLRIWWAIPFWLTILFYFKRSKNDFVPSSNRDNKAKYKIKYPETVVFNSLYYIFVWRKLEAIWWSDLAHFCDFRKPTHCCRSGIFLAMCDATQAPQNHRDLRNEYFFEFFLQITFFLLWWTIVNKKICHSSIFLSCPPVGQNFFCLYNWKIIYLVFLKF